MEISNLVGLSKPLDRLFKVIAQGVGGVFKPYLVRWNADAKAYEVRTISSAVKEVNEDGKVTVEEVREGLSF